MILIYECRLTWFKAWSGGKDTLNALQELGSDVILAVEQAIEELYPSGLTETELNDILWFEDEFIANAIGYTIEEWEDL